MSAQTMADVFAPIEAAHRARVMRMTWGHLAPKGGKVYRGSMLFAHGEYGDIVPLRAHFIDLPDSPWFFSDMMEWIAKQETTGGKIYSFHGTYAKAKSGEFNFDGEVRCLDL